MCAAAVRWSSPDEIRKLDVDVLIGTDGREAFVRHMIDAAQTRQKWDCVDDAGGPRAFEILPAGGLAARTRALLKVEDGCNNFCTYCIIPYARGRVRSMPLEAAVAAGTRSLAAEGYREIVINGIEISSWGLGMERRKSVLRAPARGALRRRAGRAHPSRLAASRGTIDEAFLHARWPGYPKSLPAVPPESADQARDSCSKAVCTANTTHARYLESVRLLRQYFPGCAVTTDLIVGFPGETDEEFSAVSGVLSEDLRALQCSTSSRYSRRAGTPAADMPGPESRTPSKSAAQQRQRLPQQNWKHSIIPPCSARRSRFCLSRKKTACTPVTP